MKYIVTGTGSTKKYLEVVRENQDGFEVEITSVGDNFSTYTTDFLPRDLFESCLRTGYITIGSAISGA